MSEGGSEHVSCSALLLFPHPQSCFTLVASLPSPSVGGYFRSSSRGAVLLTKLGWAVGPHSDRCRDRRRATATTASSSVQTPRCSRSHSPTSSRLCGRCIEPTFFLLRPVEEGGLAPCCKCFLFHSPCLPVGCTECIIFRVLLLLLFVVVFFFLFPP